MQLLKLIELDSCTSTNDVVWEELRSLQKLNSKKHALVFAHEQTKGRGSHGRQWESEGRGNLYCTFGFIPEPSSPLLKNLNWMSMVAGIAAVTALEEVCKLSVDPMLQLTRLKWPNDIYIGAKKLGGILCESKFSGEICEGISIGLGLNVLHAPELQSQITAKVFTDLLPESSSFQTHFKWIFLRVYYVELLQWIELLNRQEFSRLKEAWLELSRLEKCDELEGLSSV